MSSTPSTPTLDSDRESVGRILSRIATALFVVFAAVAISSALPPRLLDSAWQLRVIGALVNNGTIAVLGVVLMWLAGVLHPGSGRLRARRDRISNLAALAALGYLLLIPLQTYAVWKGVNDAGLGQSRQLKTAIDRITVLRQAVRQAGSTAELQARLQALQGPALPQAEAGKSIDAIRPQILAGLETAENTVRQRLGGLPLDRLWQLIQESVRVVVSSVAYAAAFASAGYLPGKPLSLMDTWLLGFRRNRRRAEAAPKPTGGRRSSGSNAEYLRELSRAQSSSSSSSSPSSSSSSSSGEERPGDSERGPRP